MKRLAAAAAILLMSGLPASAHRLDEYLQATTISVEKDRVHAEIRLTPGVAVFRDVIAKIDADSDGLISEAEQRGYAERVLGDLSLAIDGERLQLRLVSVKFGKIEEMKEGLGEIQVEFDAVVPGGGGNRRLVFENKHQSRISAYLVNCLVPADPDIRITAQNRNYQQSFYEVDYSLDDIRSRSLSSSWWLSSWMWLTAAVLFLFAGFTRVWRRQIPR